MKLTFNGRPLRPEDFTKEVMRAAVSSIAEQLRARISACRHPETGEFPTVIVRGDTLEDMSIRVEGSQALLEIVRSKLSPEEAKLVAMTRAPHVFLSYGGEDRLLAKKIAEGLIAKGIQTWWAEWEINPGDSIRRRIDAGLSECTHFVVLLTPTSISKPWVNEEIDAAFMLKVNAHCSFIPLRHNLPASQLPPLMGGLLSPEIDVELSGLDDLVNKIRNITGKPPLGPAPAVVHPSETGYSQAANAVAKLFVTTSRHGHFADPQIMIGDICAKTDLSEDDVNDALHELRHFVQVSFGRVFPKDILYAEFDRYWTDWVPEEDALRLAADLVNDPQFPSDPKKIGDRYNWTPRRLNPAISYLHERRAANVLQGIMSGPYITARIMKTDNTRRFVKSRT